MKRLKEISLLLLEDDLTTSQWLSRILALYCKTVYCASTLKEASDLLNQHTPDIVLVDVRLPDGDGIDFLHTLSQRLPQSLKIVMTAFNESDHLTRAIASGARMYLKKPIDIDELLVMMSANLTDQTTHTPHASLSDGFCFDPERRTLTQGNQQILLTKKELLVLELLLQHRGSVVSLNQIEHAVWDEPTTPDAIRMVIKNLRAKSSANLIKTVKGLGYLIHTANTPS